MVYFTNWLLGVSFLVFASSLTSIIHVVTHKMFLIIRPIRCLSFLSIRFPYRFQVVRSKVYVFISDYILSRIFLCFSPVQYFEKILISSYLFWISSTFRHHKTVYTLYKTLFFGDFLILRRRLPWKEGFLCKKLVLFLYFYADIIPLSLLLLFVTHKWNIRLFQ